MRVLLTTVGSSGDVNPFIALGLELARRGHEPTLLVNPYFEANVRATGLGFEPLGDPLDPVQVSRENPLCFNRYVGSWMVIHRWFAPMVPTLVQRTIEAARATRAELLVGHQISFGLPWAAQELGLPWATCVLSPATLLSAHDPSQFPVGADLQRRPMWYRKFANASARRAMSFMLDRPLNAHRRQMGLPPERDVFWTQMFAGSATLGLWSPALRGPAPDDPDSLRICGFPWHDRTTSHGEQGQRLSTPLERFLDHPEAPVVFTLGSVLSHTSRPQFEVAAKACARMGLRAVLVTGNRDAAPGNLPTGVIATDYAPYSLLMPRARANVHHGGVGTTAQAMRAGKPMIIVPFAHDQFDHAARLSRAGVAAWLPKPRFRVRQLERVLSALLNDGAMNERAAALGRQVQAEQGVQRAAETLERVHPSGGV